MVTLVILDGFGESEKIEGNAIKLAGTPNIDKLLARYPHTLIKASGRSAGLPDKQMGNSEAGHLTIGSGRVVFQPLERINNAIEDKSFFKNSVINNVMDFPKDTSGALHIIGLLSDGGVHSHIKHLKAIIEMATNKNLNEVYLHLFTDGRDTGTTEGLKYVKEIEEFCKDKTAKIASLCGRFYGMDREKQYDRTMQAYDAIVLGQAQDYYQTASEGIEESYKNGITDEFIKPFIIGKPKTINADDGVLFFNFRLDRMRQITEAITAPSFDKFPRKHLKNNYFVSMCQYDETFTNVNVAFKTENVKNCLSEVISQNHKKQFHIAETTKYAHVTYYFNGGREEPFENEDRKLIETIKTGSFVEYPQMRANEITTEVVEAIISNKYDFILVNLSNPDMLGHTADIEATKKAITCVDKCAYAIALASLMAGGECIVTADHGNAEKLLEDDGSSCTAHTTNLVPFILVSEKGNKYKLKQDGEISNIAGTVLDLLNIEIPKEMNDSMLEK